MKITGSVRKILAAYEGDNAGVKSKLAQILGSGKLGGTGKLIILPVDQGFEHGPARSFAVNPDAYDPQYHYRLAIDAGLSAYAAPLGMLEAGADTFAGQIPTILKMNSANSLMPSEFPKDQAITACVKDALRIGASAIGFTVYPGSSSAVSQFEEVAALREEAASYGIPTVIWSYPRGEGIEKEGETALDITAYAAHMAALLGAHIIKVKLPSETIAQAEAAVVYGAEQIDVRDPVERVRHVVESAFGGRRIVVFSGGAKKGVDGVYNDALTIRDGGGNGSIIGRNTFQRPRDEALEMLQNLVEIYKNKS